LILIDENVPEEERLALLRWKASQIGYDFLKKGVLDDEICIRLRDVRQATFFTLDRGFFTDRRQYGHARIAIFRTHASRMGRVFKISENMIVCWRVGDSLRTEIPW